MAEQEARHMTITVTNVMPTSGSQQPLFVYRRRPSSTKMSPFRRAVLLTLALALVLTLFTWLAFTKQFF